MKVLVGNLWLSERVCGGRGQRSRMARMGTHRALRSGEAWWRGSAAVAPGLPSAHEAARNGCGPRSSISLGMLLGNQALLHAKGRRLVWGLWRWCL